jgi:hypothetical protein
VGQHAFHLAVHDEHVVPRFRIRRELGARSGEIGNRENREIALGKWNPLRLVDHDVHAELPEKLEDASRFRGARAVVIARHHHDDRIRKRRREARELRERIDDRRVHRAHGVEHVAGDDDDVGRERDHAIDRTTERVGDIRFALIDSGWREPMVLPEAQMEVGEVYEAHPPNLPLEP